MSEGNALVVLDEPTDQPVIVDVIVSRPPEHVLEEARNAAKALRDVITKKEKPVKFNGEQYLEFEDWQTVGRFYAITAKEEGDPEFVELAGAKGFKASSVALWNGRVISRATAFCLNDEANWRNKPIFQLASMAQTRANSKVLRNVLSWVVVLAGYRPTPAEEMDGVIQGESRQIESKPVPKPKPATGSGAPLMPYGRSKGKEITDPGVPLDDLVWMVGTLDEAIKDPKKKNFKDKNQALREAIDQELVAREKVGSAVASEDEWDQHMDPDRDLSLK